MSCLCLHFTVITDDSGFSTLSLAYIRAHTNYSSLCYVVHIIEKEPLCLPFLLPEYLNDQTQMICLMCLPHLYTLIQREYICVLVGQT